MVLFYVVIGFGEEALRSTFGKLEGTVSVGTGMSSKRGEFWSIGWAMEKGVSKVTKAA